MAKGAPRDGPQIRFWQDPEQQSGEASRRGVKRGLRDRNQGGGISLRSSHPPKILAKPSPGKPLRVLGLWQQHEAPGHPQGDSQGEPHRHTGRPKKAPGYAHAARKEPEPQRKPQDTLRKVQRDLDLSRFHRAFNAWVRMLLRSNRCSPSVRALPGPAIPKGLGEAITHGEP